jgi:hypothetical protein
VVDFGLKFDAKLCYLVDCTEFTVVDVKVDEKIELVALNREMNGGIRFVGDQLSNTLLNFLLKKKQEQRRAEIEAAKDPDNQEKQDEAEKKRQETKEAEDDLNKSKKTYKGALGVEFDSDENLLGGTATLFREKAGLRRILGSFSATVPDIQLTDALTGTLGTLRASTRDFTPEQDDLRRVGSFSVDMAALLAEKFPLFPGGKFTFDYEVLSGELTAISYVFQPTLKASQDVRVAPTGTITLDFSRAVDVERNGELLEQITSIEYQDTDRLVIHHGDAPVTVTPSATLAARLHNTIGLDLEVNGALEALKVLVEYDIPLVAEGTLIEAGPLVHEEHEIATFSLGPIFNKEFDLPTQTMALAPFVLGPEPAVSFVKGPDQQVLEDAGVQTITDWATEISPAGSNFVVVSNSNQALFSQPPAISPQGVLTYSPAADQFGQATIVVQLTDGADNSTEESFTIDVLPVNDAPSFAPGADITVDGAADEQLHTFPGWATDISVGPANEAEQSPTFEITGNSNPDLFAQPPAIDADGRLTFTSAAGAAGDAEITVVLRDDGGANPGEDASPAALLTITIRPEMPDEPMDVNADGIVTISDLLGIVAYLRSAGTGSPAPQMGPPYPDVTRDGIVNFADLLAVVQYIRAQLETSAGEGEPHDAVFAESNDWTPPPVSHGALDSIFDEEEEEDGF